MRISILGGGSWGTALAIHLARKNNNSIKIWEFFPQQATQMQKTRLCPLLPQEKIPNKIFISSDIGEILLNAEVILIVVPSDKVEETTEKAKSFISNQPVIICSKGFAGNGRLLSGIVREKISGNIYCLYGPTHAEEVCQGMFTGVVLAGTGQERTDLQKLFQSDDLKVEISDDIIGVQIAAALKNILAVFVGIIDGMSLGDNAKAYVMTKGLEEIERIGVAMGGKKETFYGLAGMGDVIVTCTSKHSRNRHVGYEVGKGRKLEDVLKEMRMVAEGVTTARNLPLLLKKNKTPTPVLNGLYDILFNGKSPKLIFKDFPG